MGLAEQMMADSGQSGYQIDDAAAEQKYGLPPGTLSAFSQIESNNNPDAINKNNRNGTIDRGRFQVNSSNSGINGNDPDQVGAFVKNLYDKAGGDMSKMAAMYNAGPNGNWNSPAVQNYVARYNTAFKQLNGGAPAATSNTSSTKPSGIAALMEADANAGQSTTPSKVANLMQSDAQSASQPSMTDNLTNAWKVAANPANAIKGAGEFALNNITGAVGAAAGGLRGLYDLATGQGLDKSVQDIHNTQQNLTYAPKTAAGQAFTEAVGDAMNLAKKGSSSAGAAIGDIVGGNKGRLIGESIGNVVPDVAMTLAGGKAALEGGKTLGDAVNISAPSLDEIRQAVNGTSTTNATSTAVVPKARYKLNADGSVSAPMGDQQSVVARTLSDLQKTQTQGVTPSSVAPPESAIGQRIAQAQDAIAKKDPSLPASQVQRHAEAQSLPVPMDLTAAQASGDPVAISNELNMRAKYPQTAQLLNQQNGALLQNLNAVREKAAPYIGTNPTDIGQALVDSYKKMDAAAQDNVTQQYKAVTDANAGKFPLDVNKFLDNAKNVLEQKNVAEFVPPEVQSLLGRLQQNPNMTFDNFINIDKILSQQERAAMNSPKGQTGSYAVGLIRNELNKVPAMSDTTAPAYQALAQARATARARFEAINRDPAYKAVVNDDVPAGSPSPLADKFVNGYIANGKTANVNNMMQNLSRDPMAQQAIKAGFLDNIRQASGVDLRTNQGTISQAGLNKALQNAGNKTQLILGDDAHTLNTIGNVASYTQKQPPGSYVNNANTLVGAMKDAAKNSVETALNIKTLGAYGGAKALLENVFRNNKKPSSVMLSDLAKKR